jgi:hypothetical protein
VLAAELGRSFLQPRLCWEESGHNRLMSIVSVSAGQVVSGVSDGDHVMCVSDDLELVCFEHR